MIIADRKIYENMPFEDYLSTPGISYSTIKNDGNKITPTTKMRFGSLVDAFTFEPATYTGEMYNLVRPVSIAVSQHLGPLLKAGKRQVVVTCNMIHEGMVLMYKGRIDLFAANIVFDMKISSIKNVLTAINHFGYHNQLNGYSLATGAATSYLFSINPETLKVSPMVIPNSSTWWEAQVLKYGDPI